MHTHTHTKPSKSSHTKRDLKRTTERDRVLHKVVMCSSCITASKFHRLPARLGKQMGNDDDDDDDDEDDDDGYGFIV